MSDKLKSTQVMDLLSPAKKPDFDDSPVRHIFCVKSRVNMEQFDETDDCFMLDFNPFENVGLSSNDKKVDADGDVCIVAEKGQVACRDYPHSRDLCQKFLFEKTPHESYCELCYCYVCDSSAPCKYWTNIKSAHCHATGCVNSWKVMRKERKKKKKKKKGACRK